MRRKRSLTSDERALWRHVTATVTALGDRDRRLLNDDAGAVPPCGEKKRAAEPAGRSSKRRRVAPAGKVAKPIAEARQDPPPREAGDRRARRGRVEIEARIDLHGLRFDEARRALLSFLQRAQGQGLRSTLVITGKGAMQRRDAFSNENRGVIRASFTDWLAEPAFAGLVWGYAPAHRRHGGGGAFYVFVKKR